MFTVAQLQLLLDCCNLLFQRLDSFILLSDDSLDLFQLRLDVVLDLRLQLPLVVGSLGQGGEVLCFFGLQLSSGGLLKLVDDGIYVRVAPRQGTFRQRRLPPMNTSKTLLKTTIASRKERNA